MGVYSRPRPSFVVVVVSLLAALLLAGTAAAALTTVGRPFPSLFVDPYGDFSAVYLPAWRTTDFGVRLADRCVMAGGTPISRAPGATPARRFDDIVVKAAANGARTLSLVFTRNGAEIPLSVPLRMLAAPEVWWFYGLYAVAGVVILWTGAVSYLLTDRHPGTSANFALSISAFTFLLTFFDYHTTRWFAPLFAASSLANPTALVAVALFFPTPLEPPRRTKRAFLVLLSIAAPAILLLAIDALVVFDARPLRLFVNLATILGLMALGAATLARLRTSRGNERQKVVSAIWGLSISPIFLAIGFAINSLLGLGIFHLLLPIGVVLFPVSVGFALIRHNILGTDEVLSRRLFAVPALLAGFATSASVYWTLGALSDAAARAASASLDIALFGGALAFGAWKLVERFAFASTIRYRPSLEQLRDRLAREPTPSAVRTALVDVVQTWIDAEGVEVVSPPAAGTEGENPDLWRRLSEADREFYNEGDVRVLYAALRLRGQTLGALRIPGKRRGAPFTSEDLALIRTLASFGALGLQHVEAMGTLENLRSLEAGASREGQRLAVDTLSAEVAHEIAYPLTYFRNFLTQLAKGEPIEDKDIEIGREEVDRLARMLELLHRLQVPSYALSPLDMTPVLERAVLLLRRGAAERRVRVALSTPSSVWVIAHPDPLLQLFLNLLKNAILAVNPGGTVEVCADPNAELGITIDVRDSGPGIPTDLASTIFQHWVTTRAEGTGLGLPVASRIVGSFGWDLAYLREGDWTVFRITAPMAVEPLEESP